MSLQHSEARRDVLREALAAGAPPPSPGALARKAMQHRASTLRVAAEARRRQEVVEAMALGVAVVVKPTLDRSWTEEEDAVVRALYPHYGAMHAKLPHRSREALQRRATHLDLIPTRKLWTAREVDTLRRLWPSVTAAELVAALPRWKYRSISRKADHLGLKLRGRPPLLLTGNALCDAIRDRCRVLGYPMTYLDQIARSATYFQHCEWRGKAGHLSAPMIRAVNALGGELRVEWPD